MATLSLHQLLSIAIFLLVSILIGVFFLIGRFFYQTTTVRTHYILFSLPAFLFTISTARYVFTDSQSDPFADFLAFTALLLFFVLSFRLYRQMTAP